MNKTETISAGQGPASTAQEEVLNLKETMKAIAVLPGRPNTIHLREVPKPHVSDVPNGRGVLVKILRVGVDGTDKEINAAEYGAAPAGDDFLILGHESFGRVEAVGPNVTELKPGDYVAATVRRPGSSLYDTIGTYDMTTDDTYFERGINLRHGFLTEYYVDDPEYIVRVPSGLKEVGVLMEPTSVAEKAIAQAYEVQRRFRVWRPRRAAVLGAGTLGLLTTLFLRLRGLEVVTLGLTPGPYLNSTIVEAVGARYVSTKTMSLREASETYGPFDIIVEGTGYSPLVFEAMEVLAKNGVLVMVSVTGGERKLEIPADKINLGFVLGNKVAVGSVNANREYFETGVKDLADAELSYPGWLRRLLTHPVEGLENYETLLKTLTEAKCAIKVYCDVASM
ncbi:MAG TPA: glucose 1-dehydrogenase [Candidatus Acidoferrum sp.]|nr:glucose 1-dehydrogenase [Candidatus Acidoferrum sp.]